MYLPTIPEFIWAFSRFIDAVLEVPQLKRVYISEELDKWIVAYYCCIGSRVVFYVISAVYRFVGNRNDIPAGGLISLDSVTLLGTRTNTSSMSLRQARRSSKGLSLLYSSSPVRLKDANGRLRTRRGTHRRFRHRTSLPTNSSPGPHYERDYQVFQRVNRKHLQSPWL